jgi:F420-non-reducing hydrogenase iron-sulfur subunit
MVAATRSLLVRSVRKMVIEASPAISLKAKFGASKAQITVFHCFNALNNTSFLEGDHFEIRNVKLPCSSMTRELVLLRAFESGADAVVVLVCPEGACRYMEGNLRATKRVARMKKLLDEIGIEGRRLNIYHIPHGDESAVHLIINQTLSDLAILGPNPAA